MGTAVRDIEAIPWRRFQKSAAPALVERGLSISYAELADRVDARRVEFGINRKLIRIRAANDVESLVSYLATIDAGHVAWLEAPAFDSERHGTSIRPDVEVSARGGEVAIVELNDRPAPLHPDLALVLSTSGSTGTPRLVRLSHENIRANAEAIVEYLGISSDDRALTSLPMHYCYGLSVAHSHLTAGGCLLLTDASVSESAFWELGRREQATSFAAIPHTFDLLDRVGFEEMELPDLRYVTQAGGKLDADRVRRFAELGRRQGWQLVVMYGQTEATARMAYLPPELATSEPGSIGIPIPGGAFEIDPIDDAEDPAVGELVYRGPNVMLGYAESSEDLARGRDVDELRTGDLAQRTSTGLYEIIGRRSRFVKPFGLRIDLAGLERLLSEHEVDAVCTGTDERLVVAVVGECEPDRVATIVSDRVGLPRYVVAVHSMREIPRIPSGKPDYRALLDLAREVEGPQPARSVAGVFASAFEVDVRPEDSFVSLGGDSLSYVEVSVALEELIGELPPDWPDMTVAELTAVAVVTPQKRSRLHHLEIDVALRAGAITLVVASHMTDFWPAGGAHLLLALAGYSFARFLLTGADAPRRTRRWLASIGRIAIPSIAWIALLAVTVGGFSVGAVFLVNNVVGESALTGARWHYWFIEALVQILLVATLLFSMPAVRRLERRWPFGFALGLTLLLLVPAIAAAAVSSAPGIFFFTWVVAWIFALGWAVEKARSVWQRAALSLLATVGLIGFFDDPVRGGVVLLGVLILTWLAGITVPRTVVRVVAPVASASLAIYLTHWQVYPEAVALMPVGLAFVATMLVGVAAWLAATYVARAIRATIPSSRTPRRPPAASWTTATSAGRR